LSKGVSRSPPQYLHTMPHGAVEAQIIPHKPNHPNHGCMDYISYNIFLMTIT
jgi:hypothetical protein